jgi:hypothetical protein
MVGIQSPITFNVEQSFMGHSKEQRKSALTKLSDAFTVAKIPAVLSEKRMPCGTKYKVLSIHKDFGKDNPTNVQFWFDPDGNYRLMGLGTVSN